MEITTELPRGNGQVKRANRTIIPVLTKLSLENEGDWYKHTDRVRKSLNSTYCRSLGESPIELLVGVRMRQKKVLGLLSLIEEEYCAMFLEKRDGVRKQAKAAISKLQDENRRLYNKKRKKVHQSKVGGVVAVKRTQFANQSIKQKRI